MMMDILTITQKEWKELLRQRGNSRGGLVGMMIFMGVFGIILPIQIGVDWVESPVQMFILGWLPFLLVSGVIADSFAGERERHTLETLLASRLSNKAILFGKIAAAVSYGWGMAMICMLMGLVTVNLTNGDGGFLLFNPFYAIGTIVLSFLISALASGLGVLVSLRASTVRQAQQIFSFAFLLLFLPTLLLPTLPNEWQARLIGWVSDSDFTSFLLGTIAVLILIDSSLIAAAAARFQRPKLILD